MSILDVVSVDTISLLYRNMWCRLCSMWTALTLLADLACPVALPAVSYFGSLADPVCVLSLIILLNRTDLADLQICQVYQE